jgi:hypothetical protein
MVDANPLYCQAKLVVNRDREGQWAGTLSADM